MKTIIVGTDLSLNGAVAIRYAADMALATDAHLHILHVHQPTLSYVELALHVDSGSMVSAAEKEMEELKEYFEKLTKGRLYISTEVRMGDVIEELQQVCKRISPDFVVIGAQGKSAAARFFLGSHAVRIMRQLKWPVIAVPKEGHFRVIKKIGLACDLNDVVESIPIDEIKLLVKSFNAELHVINSGKMAEFYPEELDQSIILRELLEAENPTFHFIVNKSGDNAILEFAEQNEIDLLIIIPGHHSVIKQLVTRSHTRKMVLQSHVPVMSLQA
ncbi:universal stress protein [Pollutibacter soli]|uniref:universal stress protein n=1 Tax=Pollutibacter soli TaxID=3034157 RepID=UPI0030137A3E